MRRVVFITLLIFLGGLGYAYSDLLFSFKVDHVKFREGWYKARITYEDYDEDYSDAVIGPAKYTIEKLYYKRPGYCPIDGTKGEVFQTIEGGQVVVSCLDLIADKLDEMKTEEINKFLNRNTCYESRPDIVILICPNDGNLFTYPVSMIKKEELEKQN
jgi:hypothetical protein